MDVKSTFSKIVRVERQSFSPGVVPFHQELPATRFQVEEDVFLSKIVAGCRAVTAATVNIQIPTFAIFVFSQGGIDQNGIGVNNSLNTLSNNKHGAFSTLQSIEINYPDGLQINKTQLIEMNLAMWFPAALAAGDLVTWFIDFYFQNPAPITILFEDVTK
jgi:hypothetical protein